MLPDPAAADQALSGAVKWLLERQDPAGWWSGELETNVTMTAEHVLLLRFLGLPLDGIREGAIEHITRNQREDGSWGLFFEAPADLSTTIEAYSALKVLGVDTASDTMRRALQVIHQQGGVAEARVFTKIWLALFGQYPWEGVPSMPPELVFLPSSVPLNLYNFACWARGTVAPLLIVLSRRPVRPIGVSLNELVLPGTEQSLRRVPGSGFFWWLDHLQKLYQRLPGQPGRRTAVNRLTEWIVAHQEADGSWGGIQPPWVYSLLALNLEGMGLEHRVMRRGLGGLERFAIRDRQGWRLQACMSPVWDTAWALLALVEAGLDPSHPALDKAVRWTLNEQISRGGDWQVRLPSVEGAGWAFEFDNDLYPDVDDTAVVALALKRAGRRSLVEEGVRRAVRWTVAMRSSNGAWAAFDRDNTSQIVYKLPFSDFGAMLDPPTEDVTAHVLELLAAEGWTAQDPVVAGGLRYLRQAQTAAGSWFGRWGVNHVYGTWCVIAALSALKAGGDMVRRGAGWLLERQNLDGGWGETCWSYEDPSFAGVGSSTPSQTAWAVIALQRAGLADHPACRRGVNYILERQVGDTWDEPEYTGTGFPRDFYINYHLYRHLFPTLALAGASRPTNAEPAEQTLEEVK